MRKIALMIVMLILTVSNVFSQNSDGNDKLLSNIGSATVWKCTDAADRIVSNKDTADLYSKLITVGYMILGIAAVLQILNKYLKSIGGGQLSSTQPGMIMIEIVISLLLFSFLISGPTYRVLIKHVIAFIPDHISQVILDSFYDKFNSKIVKMIQAEKDGVLQNSVHFLSIVFESMSISSFLSGIMWLITKAMLFIFPLVQKMVFTVLVIMGPICLPFGMCDWTKKIAFGWLGLALTVAFWGVVGSACFWVYNSFDMCDVMVIGSIKNTFLVLAYGLGSIILFFSSFAISASIFSGISGIGILTSGALISSAAAMVQKAYRSVSGSGSAAGSNGGSSINGNSNLGSSGVGSGNKSGGRNNSTAALGAQYSETPGRRN
ncbi:MAG: type IV secretion system protein [Fibrobacter sp.]|nr:type IV secretion system protein [Fibrobacter sp.]